MISVSSGLLPLLTAQSLPPRAYLITPTGSNAIILSFGYNSGGTLPDAGIGSAVLEPIDVSTAVGDAGVEKVTDSRHATLVSNRAKIFRQSGLARRRSAGW